MVLLLAACHCKLVWERLGYVQCSPCALLSWWCNSLKVAYSKGNRVQKFDDNEGTGQSIDLAVQSCSGQVIFGTRAVVVNYLANVKNKETDATDIMTHLGTLQINEFYKCA